MVIGKMSVDTRFRDRSPRPIRHRQDDRYTNNCNVRSRELQIMLRYILGGISEEDLVVLLYFLLASAHLSRHEVETYSPEILGRRRLVVDGRDEEIIAFLVKSPKGICFVKPILLLSKQGTPLSQKNRLPVETGFQFATLVASSSAVVQVGPHRARGSYHCWSRCNDEFLRSAW